MLRTNENRPPLEKVISKSATTKGYWNQWERLKLKNGLLYRRWQCRGRDSKEILQIIPPMKYRREVLEKSHEGLANCHLGLRRTKERVQKKAYWIGWSTDVERFHAACHTCARFFRGTPRRQGQMQTAPVGEPWERLAVDITGPHPRSKNGFTYILTAIDTFTRWAFAIPIRHHDAVTVAHVLVDKVFSVFGIPGQILTDRGAEFEGRLMKELCRILEIEKLRTTAYKPSTNGIIERFHRTLNGFLGKVINENQRDWDQWIPAVLAAYHASRHEATGFSPNYLVLGREVRLPLDLVYGTPEDATKHQTYEEVVMERWTRQRDAFEMARQHIGRAAERSKQYYDLKVRPKSFDVGSWIWVYNPRRYVGRSPKWQKLYTGPFLVVGKLGIVNLVVQRSPKANKQVIHVDKAKMCFGDTPKSWLPEEDRIELEDLQIDGHQDEASTLVTGQNTSEMRTGCEQIPEWDPEKVSHGRRKPERKVCKPARFRDNCVVVERKYPVKEVMEGRGAEELIAEGQRRMEIERKTKEERDKPKRDIRKPSHFQHAGAYVGADKASQGEPGEVDIRPSGWPIQIKGSRVVQCRSTSCIKGDLLLLDRDMPKKRKKKKEGQATKLKQEQSKEMEQIGASLGNKIEKGHEEVSGLKPTMAKGTDKAVRTAISKAPRDAEIHPCSECGPRKHKVFKTKRGLNQHVRAIHKPMQGMKASWKKPERESLEEEWLRMVQRGALEVPKRAETADSVRKRIERTLVEREDEGSVDIDDIQISSQEWLTHEETNRLIEELQGTGSFEDLLVSIGL